MGETAIPRSSRHRPGDVPSHCRKARKSVSIPQEEGRLVQLELRLGEVMARQLAPGLFEKRLPRVPLLGDPPLEGA